MRKGAVFRVAGRPDQHVVMTVAVHISGARHAHPGAVPARLADELRVGQGRQVERAAHRAENQVRDTAVVVGRSDPRVLAAIAVHVAGAGDARAHPVISVNRARIDQGAPVACRRAAFLCHTFW
jgi:hypothetical protein